MKLWIYTNYDCNLRCRYCVARSSPRAARRAIGLAELERLVDEALNLGFDHIYLTGGEPLILDEIYAMAACASQRVATTLLTNAMLVKGVRLEKLSAIRNDNLIMQVSLDGAQPEHHESYRGAGSWAGTVQGIQNLIDAGFHVRLATTETPANREHLEAICVYHRALGIPEEDHFVRPLARRGFSTQGIEVGMDSLVPEITVDRDGVYWHPLSTDQDMLIREEIFPLADAVACVRSRLEKASRGELQPNQEFT
jgi:MoaA/NifB/PqqE/SkfB family radical SAM enzyme